MSNYTSDSDNIYFLNDKNIANGVDDECPAGFNAVPSQDAFVGKYKELSARDKELSDYIQNNIETSCASISSRLTAFEAAAATDYLKTTGGEISGSLSIRRTLSVGETLVVEGQVSSKYVQTGDDGSITFTAPDKHGKIVFDFEHGVEDIVVNGKSETLCSFVQNEAESAANAAKTAAEKHSDDNREAAKKYADDQIGSRIDGLDYAGVSADSGKMIGSISQTDGVISATIREITSADIPALPEAKIENLAAKYATKSDVANEYVKAKNLDFYYNKSNDNCIWLVDKDHDVSLSVDCAGFVKDGMISSVKILDEGTGYSKENGPYLVITWNADGGGDQTWIKIRDFFKVCVSTDENGGLSVNDYKIWLNYDVVAKTADVKLIEDYVDSLSAPAVGAIDVLSSGISALNVQNVRQMKFDGHIKHAEKSLKEIIKANSDTAVEDLVRNNSIFDVMFTDAELSAPSASYETTDGFTLGNGDVVVIHDCNAKRESIGIDDLNENNVRVLKCGVARYEFEAEKKTRSDCDTFLSGLVDQVLSGAVKLSGDNEISGDNQFVNGMLGISSAMVSDALSVDFGKLIDNASTSSAVEICAYLSNAISSHIKNSDNPHNVTATQTSAYLCSETSSAVELSDKFNSLSASLSCDASCTVDTLIQKDGVVSARFKAISIDIDHVAGLREKITAYDTLSTYAEISSQLSNDGYATKLDMDAADAALSAAIDGKVRVDDVSATTLDVRHVDAGEYHNMVKSGTLDENTLYVVSSDTFSAYGEKIINVATPTEDMDAANKKYVDDKVDVMAKSLSVEDLTCATSAVMTKLTQAGGKVSAVFEPISITMSQVSGLPGKIAAYDKLSSYDEIHGQLSADGYATNSKVDSSDKYLSGKIDRKVWVGEYVTGTKEYKLVSADSLSVVKISSEDYYDLMKNKNVDPDVLYVVSSDVLNAYGERVVNVASPISATDAVNLEYMEGATSGIFAKNFAEALKKAESLNTYLTSDNTETLLSSGFTNRHVLSILLDIKRIFAELSSAAAG